MSEFITQNKYYVVWIGHKPGIYDSWEDCKANIHKFKGAKYKSFYSKEEADKKFKLGYEAYFKNKPKKEKVERPELTEEEKLLTPILESICVDAACSANPGPFEYRGVHTNSKRILFQVGPIPGGTNNIGEFLAIVHILALLKKHNRNDIIYSDSKTAMFWVQQKKTNTTLKETNANKKVFDMIRRAELWLKNNSYSNPILKWRTSIWGEIKADYSRK